MLDELKRCPCCDSMNYSKYCESNGYTVNKCENCEVLFVSPRPTEKSVIEHFENEYITTENRFTEHFVDYRKKSLRREARIIRKYLKEGGRLLDLGTASGEFLNGFSGDERWNVEGVEPSKYAAKLARDRYDLKITTGFLKDTAFKDSTFDVLTSLDAWPLHHNPRRDLAEIKRILKRGGVFAVEIPGLNFRLMKNAGLITPLLYRARCRLNAGVHLFYYSDKSLVSLMKREGFKLMRVYSERSPERGGIVRKFLVDTYFYFAASLRILSLGSIDVVPKKFFIFINE